MELTPNPNGNLVEVRGLAFARGSGASRKVIFDGIDLDIRAGKVTAVMGPSGTGKTTLLRVITGQQSPDAGSITVGGHEVVGMKRKPLYALRQGMGMLFQGGALLTDLSVYENVAFPLREHTDLPEPLVRQLVLTKLQAVGLRGAAELMPAELSGGMARRVALARAIVMDPALILYDEPFVGLDPIGMGVIVRLIRTLNDTLGLTSIVVSHDVHEILAVADEAFLLSEGRIVAHGAPNTLDQQGSPYVKQFMHGDADGPVPFHYPAPDLRQDLLGAPE
jgi:phospholipid/cholesterol/gamma-HCH transport system ATP-binding protein